jgi:indole-3-glycerol phosphate synthase
MLAFSPLGTGMVQLWGTSTQLNRCKSRSTHRFGGALSGISVETMSFLSGILDSTRQSVAARAAERPLSEFAPRVTPRAGDRPFRRALQQPGVSIIAEFKRSSPSKGNLLRRGRDLAGTVRQYESAGARAISILTEGTKFGGAIDDLRVARATCALPMLCKDFVIDEYQIYEAADAGADAILLIAAAFDDAPRRLGKLYDVARELGLDVLVEVRSEEDLDHALEIAADIIGINNRNLDALTTDTANTRLLAPAIPRDVTIVSESGLRTQADLAQLMALEVDAALIGTAFMSAADPEVTCRALVEATLPGDGTSSRRAAGAVAA